MKQLGVIIKNPINIYITTYMLHNLCLYKAINIIYIINKQWRKQKWKQKK